MSSNKFFDAKDEDIKKKRHQRNLKKKFAPKLINLARFFTTDAEKAAKHKESLRRAKKKNVQQNREKFNAYMREYQKTYEYKQKSAYCDICDKYTRNITTHCRTKRHCEKLI